jgi:hypothetical protein
MLDILAACSLPGTRTLLAKTWVFRAFPLGIAARAAGLANSDDLAPDAYQEGAALTLPDPRLGILVFPEGSRSRSGAIARFRPGAFVLARALDQPVVPVAIAGSRQGIRPGSMWIHPTRVHSRVLPPMRPQADEGNRQFAARVREAIVQARHQLLVEMLRDGRLARHRRHRLGSLPAPWRRAALVEERAGDWRVLLDLPRREAPWVFLGCGWSTLVVILRMLQPEAQVTAIEPDADRRAVARQLWWQPGDVLEESVAEPDLVGAVVVVTAGGTLPSGAAQAEVLLVRGEAPVLPGRIVRACAIAGWTLSLRADVEQ